MPMIRLKSSDGTLFLVGYEVIKVSETIKTMVENLGLMENDEEIVPLPKVNARTLNMIIDWAMHHKDDPPRVEPSDNRTDDISDWDKKFLKVDKNILFELMVAADYLDIKGLLLTTCKSMANMIKGKTAEQIRKTFNIKNDFTPAEEAKIAEDFKWFTDH